jgi:hypothetical protein
VAKFLVILSQKGPFVIPGLDSVKEQSLSPYCFLSPAVQMAGKALLRFVTPIGFFSIPKSKIRADWLLVFLGQLQGEL